MALKVVTPVQMEPTEAVWTGSTEEALIPYEDWVVVEVIWGL